MSLSALAEKIGSSRFDLLSTDVFDTVLLRDHTVESGRLALACRRAAPELGVDAEVLTRLRWSFHDTAYRAVAMERPYGEASLTAICRAIATALGLGEQAGDVLRRAEVGVDVEHLRPNRPLLALFDRIGASGGRIVAVSDTYYDRSDLQHILDTVAGPHSIATVYASAELGLTKHAGRVFDLVAERENVPPARILHVGDNWAVDVKMAEAASWSAVHLPRTTRDRATMAAGKLMSLPVRLRRDR